MLGVAYLLYLLGDKKFHWGRPWGSPFTWPQGVFMGPKGLGFCPLGPSQLSCRALCLPGYLLLFRDSSTWMGPVDVKEKREAPAGREGHPAWGRHLQGSSSRQLPSVPLPSRPWRASQDHHLQDPLHPPEGPPPAPLLPPGLIPPSRPSPRPSRVAPQPSGSPSVL